MGAKSENLAHELTVGREGWGMRRRLQVMVVVSDRIVTLEPIGTERIPFGPDGFVVLEPRNASPMT